MNTVTAKAVALFLAAACACTLIGCGGKPASEGVDNHSASATPAAERKTAIPVKVLILPHFEIGEMSGDFPGEAQCYYE